LIKKNSEKSTNPSRKRKFKRDKKLSRYRPEQAEAAEFLDNWHIKMIRLSALRTGRLYPQEVFLVLISLRG
jgi:hypothetical protein